MDVPYIDYQILHPPPRARTRTWGVLFEPNQTKTKRDKPTLHGIIVKHVEPGSIIHTDCWKAYLGLDKYGYEHHQVNHSDKNNKFIAPDGTHTQRIESTWRSMRRRLSRGGKPHDDLPEYMVEFMWYRQCKAENKDPFVELVKVLRA